MARKSAFEPFPKNFLLPLGLAFLLTAAINVTNGFKESQDVRSRAVYGNECGSIFHGTCVPSSYTCNTNYGPSDCGSYGAGYTCGVNCSIIPSPTPLPISNQRYTWVGNEQTGKTCAQRCRDRGYKGCNAISYNGSQEYRGLYVGLNNEDSTKCAFYTTMNNGCDAPMSYLGRCHTESGTELPARSTLCECIR